MANAQGSQEMPVDHTGNSPAKRRAGDQGENLASHLDVIREAIRGELKDALSEVKQDIRSFSNRVDNVESQVTKKMQQTLNLLDDMTQKYSQQGDILQQLQEANREVNLRPERLEKGGGSSVAASTIAPSDSARQPALIIGGWDPDSAPIDTTPLFVPGVRRGYAILPIDEPMGESYEQRRTRIQEVISKVRGANIQLGSKPDGTTKRVWIAISQPPDRRRRARLAAKVKRLYLTLGGDKGALQMEFSTGTAWVNSTKISSATAPKPGGAEDAGPGWVDIAAIAKATRTTREATAAEGGNQSGQTWAMTWNVGGLTADNLLKLLDTFSGSPDLHCVTIVLLQEIICEQGLSHAESDTWQVVYGKREGEFRGEGVAHTSEHYTHHHSRVTSGGVITTLKATTDKATVRTLAGHIPHHATIPETETILSEWGDGLGDHKRCLLGLDANESLLPPSPMYQDVTQPRAGAMQPRRLDYILVKGITAGVEQLLTVPPPRGEDPHKVLATLAKAITVPGSGHNKFQESAKLKGMRRDAQHCPPGPAARAAWKAIAKCHKQEHRAWNTKQAEQAAQLDWRALRTLQKARTHRGWQLQLQDNPDWQTQLHNHMRSIFAKPIPPGGSARITTLRDQLRRRCKLTPWQPFHIAELQIAAQRWGSNKSTGPDGISHEAAKALLAHKAWGGFITYVMNDMLYTAPKPSTDRGITVLLPKVPTPLEWTDTRPITLSSTLLKLAAQLLLARGGAYIRGEATLQWARHGRQGVELVATIRRVVQMAKDWGVPTWLVKLDIRKAFDSVWQHSMSELVAARVGGVASTRCPIPADGGDKPWEALMWLSILETRTLNVAVGDTITPVPQTNGIRQGSPDSPDLFGAIVARDLQSAIHAAPTQGPDAQGGPPPPRAGGSFLDDTYLWSQDKHHLQRLLHNLEAELSEDGLHIHPTKTAILFSQPEGGGTFEIGNTTVPCAPYKTVIATLGSPITFGEQIAAKHKGILLARTSIKARVAAYTTLVRSAALYAAETWPANQRLLRAANSLQAQHLRRMLHIERRPTEQWADWHIRSLRMARLHMQRGGWPRWSSFILQQIWSLWGHMARGGEEVNAMLQWKNLEFWRKEQRKPRNSRVNHAARFNPEADVERALESVGGTNWGETAQDRVLWHQLSQSFVDRFDVPWATGKQTSIHDNLTPNRLWRGQRMKATAAAKAQNLQTPALSDIMVSKGTALICLAAVTGSRLPPGGTRAIPGMTMREHYAWITTGEIPASYIERELLPHFPGNSSNTDDGGDSTSWVKEATAEEEDGQPAGDPMTQPGHTKADTYTPYWHPDAEDVGGTIQAALAQLQMIHEIADGNHAGELISNICAIALRMLTQADSFPHSRPRRIQAAFAGPTGLSEAYRFVASMRVRRGEGFTPEEYATDLSQLRAMVETGLAELKDPMPGDVTEQNLNKATLKLTAAYHQIDQVILRALGGDRQWNTLEWWNELHDLLAPAALLATKRGEATVMTEDPDTAHPADALAFAGEATTEWEARSSQRSSATTRLLRAAGRLKNTVPFLNGQLIVPIVETLQALEAWQQAMFGGAHAVHEQTQTGDINTEGETAAYSEQPENPEGTTEALREHTVEATTEPMPAEPHGGDGALPHGGDGALTAAQMAQMMTASLQQAVNEVGEMATIPTQDDSEADPMPGDVTEQNLNKATLKLTAAYHQIDQVILRALGGDRQWNTLEWWNELHDLLAPAALLATKRGEATTVMTEDPTMAHPARQMHLPSRGKPPQSGKHALEAWQQAMFGGAHAVHEQTQTGDVNTEGETAAYSEQPEKPEGDMEALREHTGEAATEPMPAEPHGGDGALTAAQMAQMMTASLQQAVNEVGEMATIPTQDDSEAATMPWNPPPAGGEAQLSANRARRALRQKRAYKPGPLEGKPQKGSVLCPSAISVEGTIGILREYLPIADGRDIVANVPRGEPLPRRARDPVHHYRYGLAALQGDYHTGAILRKTIGKLPGGSAMANAQGNEMPVDQAGNSPTKRRAADQGEGLASHLDVIREAIRGELKDALSEVKQDIRGFAARVDNVESQVTRKMQQTINLLDDMTQKYTHQGDILQQLQEANKEVNLRLERLEKGGGSSTAGSTIAPSDSARKPALIIGGWDPDAPAADTKDAVLDVLKSVEAPIDTTTLFVPGVRRGYAILPIDEPMGETFEQRRTRVQEVISKPPDRRRRARLAAKVKRLYLTLGALQMEFSTGSAWVNSVKVCSATAPRPGGTEEAGPGWVDIAAIAKATRTTKEATAATWSPLKAEIN
ncbi:unnamed protein product [Symbiodinium sp. CCMP2592]|nr:unnamed protein product [Symbiodinium sp. CCMP2592]